MRINKFARGKNLVVFFCLWSLLILSFPVFPAAAAEIDDIRAAIVQKQAQWTAEENEISKLPPQERSKRLGLLKKYGQTAPLAPEAVAPEGMVGAPLPPPALDWRSYNGKNYVTPVKNQGSCGSCWAFSSTAALESAALRAIDQPGTNTRLNASEQIVLDCCDTGDCGGGYISDAAVFIRDHGITWDACSPYVAHYQGYWPCNPHPTCSSYPGDNYRITTFYSVLQNVTSIKNALMTWGPLVTAYKVYTDFYSYHSGVYSYSWGSWEGNHAVLIVGWDDANSCFIVKNSWGAAWGEKGYFRVAYSEVSSLSVTDFAYDTYAYSGAYSVAAAPSMSGFMINSGDDFTISPTVYYNGSYAGNPSAYRHSTGAGWSSWYAIATPTPAVTFGNNGHHNIFIQLKDKWGRFSTLTYDDIYADLQTPQGRVKINGGNATVKGNGGLTPVWVDLAMFSANMSVPYMRIKEGSTFANPTELWESFSATYKSWNLAAGFGTRTIYAQFMDDAGKKSAVYSASITVSSSATAPLTPSIIASPTMVQLNGGVTYATSPAVVLTYIPPAISGLKARYCFIDSAGTLAWTAWGALAGGAVTKNLTILSGNGLRQVYVQLKDPTGAITHIDYASILLDASAPAGGFMINNGLTSIQRAGDTTYLTLTIVSNDTASGISQIAIYQSGEAVPAPITAGDPRWEAFTTQKNNFPLATTSIGTKSVFMWFKDVAGKISAMQTRTITVTD